MVKSWVASGKSKESIATLEAELAKLEARKEGLLDAGKGKLADWAALTLKKESATQQTSYYSALDKEVRELLAEYESLKELIVEKQMLLNERLNEQVKRDSLG